MEVKVLKLAGKLFATRIKTDILDHVPLLEMYLETNLRVDFSSTTIQHVVKG